MATPISRRIFNFSTAGALASALIPAQAQQAQSRLSAAQKTEVMKSFLEIEQAGKELRANPTVDGIKAPLEKMANAASTVLETYAKAYGYKAEKVNGVYMSLRMTTHPEMPANEYVVGQVCEYLQQTGVQFPQVVEIARREPRYAQGFEQRLQEFVKRTEQATQALRGPEWEEARKAAAKAVEELQKPKKGASMQRPSMDLARSADNRADSRLAQLTTTRSL